MIDLQFVERTTVKALLEALKDLPPETPVEARTSSVNEPGIFYANGGSSGTRKTTTIIVIQTESEYHFKGLTKPS